jgi:hypothetical protein
MPTNAFVQGERFTQDLYVFVNRDTDFRIGGTFDNSKISATAQLKKTLLSGHILNRLPSGRVAILPRARVQAAVSTGATITVKDARCFIAGNILTAIAPTARVQLGGTYANGDTITFTVDAVPVVHTVANYSTNTALGVALAQTLNNSAPFASRCLALTEGGYVYVYAKDMRSLYTFAAAETSTAGTVTVLNSATALAANLAIGTIQSVNVDAGVITLTAGSTNRLPAGMPIGVDTLIDIIGIVETPRDLVEDTDDVIACAAGTINNKAIFYFDREVASKLPEINTYYAEDAESLAFVV